MRIQSQAKLLSCCVTFISRSCPRTNCIAVQAWLSAKQQYRHGLMDRNRSISAVVRNSIEVCGIFGLTSTFYNVSILSVT